jgi:putative membrane protein
MNALLASTSWPDHWWFPLFPLAWIIALVLLFRFVLPRGFCGWRGGGGMGPDRAHGILAERYARGEIDEAEYRARRDRLRSDT